MQIFTFEIVKPPTFQEFTVFRTQIAPNCRFRLFSHNALYFRHSLVLPPATLNPSKLDWSDWQRLTYGKDCHKMLALIPTEGGPYGDDECIFT